MPVITKITRQKKNLDRYNIYLDEAYAFSVDESVLIQHQLTKGKVLVDFEMDDMIYEDEVRKAFSAALNYLSYRMRSEQEVKKKLLDVGYGEAVALEAIKKLHDYNYINDEAFSIALLSTEKNSSKKGPNAIRQSLKQKGIDEETRQQTLEGYTEQEQLEVAMALAEKVLRSSARLTPSQQKKKIQDLLARKGFPFQIGKTVIQRLEDDFETDGWADKLADQGEKAWRKASSKYSGRERRQKVKQQLYGKGFPLDIIDAFIEQKEQEDG